MIISLFLILILNNILYNKFCHAGCIYSSTSPNVRTVLFSAYDIKKTCWTSEEIGLLLTRYLIQELLPIKVPRNITLLNEYMILCKQTMTDLVVSEKALNVIKVAYADTFGGYLNNYGIPLVNEAFYEGNVLIDVPITLHNTQNDLKRYLNTGGYDWAKPIQITRPINEIKPLKLHRNDYENYCDKMILIKKCDKYNKKKNDKNFNNATNENKKCPTKNKVIPHENTTDCTDIPLPFYDDCVQPHAIALPLKQHCLISLTDSSSQGIFSEYYETSINCLRQKSANKTLFGKTLIKNCDKCIINFCKKFYEWSEKNIIPHLHDATWYPAFDGILRVIKTNDNILSSATNSTKGETDVNEDTHSWFFVLVVVVLLAFFWLIISTCLVCRKYFWKDEENVCDENCPECKGENFNDKCHIGPLWYKASCWKSKDDVSSDGSDQHCTCGASDPIPKEMVGESESHQTKTNQANDSTKNWK